MDFFNPRNLFSFRKHNELAAMVLPFRKLTITRGATDEVIQSESNVVLQLAKSSASGASSYDSIVQMVVTAINEDSWTATDGTATHTVIKPPTLKCSLVSGNIDVYSSVGAHSLKAVTHVYSEGYTKRVSSVSGYVDETAYLIPSMQPLYTDGIASMTSSGGNYIVVTNASTTLYVGQYVKFNGCGGVSTANGGWHAVVSITNGYTFRIAINGTLTLTSPTIEFGGSVIIAGRDADGNYYDLNVDGRQWSQVPVNPSA